MTATTGTATMIAGMTGATRIATTAIIVVDPRASA
jgi:hypothetical protein